MSLIDTRGPAEFFLRGRGMAQQEQAQQQQVRENAARMAQQASQFDQRHALDLQQFELQRQEQLRRQAEDEAVAGIMREQYSRLIPTAPMAPGGVGPTQTDGWDDIRGSLATAPLPVLKAWGQIIPNRAKLDSMRKMLPVLVEQRSMIAPDSPERIVLDHMIDMVNVNDVEGFEKAARARVQAQTKAAEASQKRERGVQSLMRTQGWNRQMAEDQYDQQEAGLRNQLRGVTGDDRRDLSENAIQGSTEYKRAKLDLDRIQRHIDEIEASMADPSLNPNGKKLLTQMLNAAKEQERQAEDAIIEIYARQRGEAGGQPAPMAQPPQPPTQTAAPVADDPMAAAKAALGENATVEQIEQWMEAQGL